MALFVSIAKNRLNFPICIVLISILSVLFFLIGDFIAEFPTLPIFCCCCCRHQYCSWKTSSTDYEYSRVYNSKLIIIRFCVGKFPTLYLMLKSIDIDLSPLFTFTRIQYLFTCMCCVKLTDFHRQEPMDVRFGWFYCILCHEL